MPAALQNHALIDPGSRRRCMEGLNRCSCRRRRRLRRHAAAGAGTRRRRHGHARITRTAPSVLFPARAAGELFVSIDVKAAAAAAAAGPPTARRHCNRRRRRRCAGLQGRRVQ